MLILDEPANGLDPAGMAWLRGLLRDLAEEGRTVLFSSHVLSEVAQTADQAGRRARRHGPVRRPLTDLAGPDGGLEAAFLRPHRGGSRA